MSTSELPLVGVGVLPVPGSVVDGRYQLDEIVGWGSLSLVYRGRDLRLGREVAVKVLRGDRVADRVSQDRFVAQAHHVASLTGPGIAAVFDSGSSMVTGALVPYVVMEFVTGETVLKLLTRVGRLSPERAVQIAVEICTALNLAHRQGIFHGNLFSTKVMLTETGAVKVIGFGLARPDSDPGAVLAGGDPAGWTEPNVSTRTMQARVGVTADVDAALALLVLMLAGPVVAGHPAEPNANDQIGEPGEIQPGAWQGLPKSVPLAVVSVVNKGRGQDPADRYPSAARLRTALSESLAGQVAADQAAGGAVAQTAADRPDASILLDLPDAHRSAGMAQGADTFPVESAQWWEPLVSPDDARKSRRLVGFAAVGVVCLLLLAGAVLGTVKVTRTARALPQVGTPQLKDLSIGQAQDLLASSGLTLGFRRSVESATVPAGEVVRQDPSPGTPIGQGKTVGVDISVGITSVPIPNLSLLTPQEAQRLLATFNLRLTVELSESTTAQINTVISQHPPQGTAVAPGHAVTVQVGRGPSFTAVPTDLVGLVYNRAAAELAAAHLMARRLVIQGTQSAETVVQVLGPGVGERLQTGALVTLTVSNGRLFVVPDLSGQTLAAAAAELAALGWMGSSVGSLAQIAVPSTDPAIIGLVASKALLGAGTAIQAGTSDLPAQTPAIGALVDKSSRFVLAVFVKAQITMPAFVVGSTTVSDIEQQRSERGAVNWNVVIGPPAAAPELVGTFLNMDTAAGSQIPFDTTVNIVVAGAVQAAAAPDTVPQTTAQPATPVSAAPPTSEPSSNAPASTVPVRRAHR